jgi:pimeloyl-ACP methyl ester carboxylesterase
MSTINSSGVPAGRRLSRSKTTGADAAKQMVRVETVVGVTSSDDQEEDLPSGTMPLARSETGTALASKKKAKALGEIEPVMKGFGAGMRISLSSLKFLYNAFQTVRKMLVDVPHPPFVDKDERKRSVNLERVREARWWLKFSKWVVATSRDLERPGSDSLLSSAAYLQSAAAPFLLPGHARKANIAMVSRFLGIQDADMLLYQEQAGAFTSKFFVCWIAEKKSLVIAVRGTAGVQEALADLVGFSLLLEKLILNSHLFLFQNGEYIPFRTGVSHKGFVFSANYIYNNFRQQLLDWTKKLNPKRIVCTGHSYGGSVAAILSILLRDDLTQLRELAQNPGMEVEAITFGAAPTISKELSSETLHIEAYVNFLDPVPSLCYGTMLDLRELLIESDDLFDQGWDHELALDKLAMIHQRLAKSSFLKLQVAGRIWLLRESPSSIAKSSDVPAGREPGSEAKPRSLWDRLFRSRGGSDGAQPPPPATSASFAGLFASSETYIAEPCAPRDLFVLRSHPDSMAKPHLCAQYGAALKSVVSTQNNG